MSAHALFQSPIPRSVKLSALWGSLMFLFVYADILLLYKPGELGKILGGMMGPFEATQGALLLASVLMTIPSLMVFLSVGLAPRIARVLNIAVGALFTLVNIANVIGETWAFYLTFGVVEIGVTLAIIGYAWTWRTASEA